jgi:hypothetical protein
MLHTSGWVTISGTTTPEGAVLPPTKDPSMLGIWSDIHGPAIQVRAANAGAESYLFQGLDREGDYTFSVEQNGALRWGAASRASMDTNLYRSQPETLQTDGSLTVTDRLSVGTATETGNNRSPVASPALHVNGAQVVKRKSVRADYTVKDDDYYIGVVDTTQPRTVTLPPASGQAGRVLVIKDESGQASKQNSIRVRASTGETVDGSVKQTIAAKYGVLRVLCSGEAWFVM